MYTTTFGEELPSVLLLSRNTRKLCENRKRSKRTRSRRVDFLAHPRQKVTEAELRAPEARAKKNLRFWSKMYGIFTYFRPEIAPELLFFCCSPRLVAPGLTPPPTYVALVALLFTLIVAPGLSPPHICSRNMFCAPQIGNSRNLVFFLLKSRGGEV